jgi:hypothetical protein
MGKIFSEEDLANIIKVERMSASTSTHLAYLKELYNSVEIIDKEPDWKNCFNISLNENIEKQLEIILNTAAGYLYHHNKVAIKIAQMPNVIFIKTENQNA